jgi:N-acetylneuraminic acid mutarotase
MRCATSPVPLLLEFGLPRTEASMLILRFLLLPFFLLAALVMSPLPSLAADCNNNGVEDATEPDGDLDGVIDACDNCPNAANAAPLDCDTDGDDIGNACDCDFDEDGFCGLPDLSLLQSAYSGVTPDAEIDATCDGLVGSADFNAFRSGFGGFPGPGLPPLPPPVFPTLLMNFQPAAAAIPAGFEGDSGAAFGDQPNGQRYGWLRRADDVPVDASLATRDRDVAGVAQEVDTLQHMQRGDCCTGGFVDEIYWELEVPNGAYDVTVAAGDAAYNDSTHVLNFEGALALGPATQSGAAPLVATRTVTVDDGRLTVDADGGTNTKIHWIEVVAAGAPPPPPAGGCRPDPSQFDGASISPLACSEVKVSAPYQMTWSADEGAIPGAAGVGTGFTMVLPASNGSGLLPPNIAVGGGRLALTTTAGIIHNAVDSQDNALGVGLPLPDAAYKLTATLVDPPSGSSAFEQAGLWFGISERDYMKLALVDGSTGVTVQALVEQNSATGEHVEVPIALPASVEFELELDPSAETAIAAYTIGGSRTVLGTFALPSAWFSKDAAGIDFNVGTRSYAGVYATHRNRAPALGPLVYEFDAFGVEEIVVDPGPGPGPSGDVDFELWSIGGISNPTSLVWGPDDRLYAATATGTIYAFTLDRDNHGILATEQIDSTAGNLMLGLTVDPASTPDDVILWASHSDIQQSSGDANSGIMSRLSGPGHSVREDRITGVARAIANHAPNSLHFGPDGWLYMSVGGNTGAGASNDGGSEFGPRPEQPLSAAILRADPSVPGFDGDCRSTIDPNGAQMDATGIAARDVPCDVEVYASGLRNSYDFWFHSNGRLYATDNGLGVEGTVPALPPGWLPGQSCEGAHSGSTEIAAHNPGRRPDLLYEVEPGDYMGHPNPSRDECVFFGGNPTASDDHPVPAMDGGTDYLDSTVYASGTAPESNWKPPLFSFALNKSANGILEYQSQSFCGELAGELLVAYYSQQDQIRRLRLTPDGLSVDAEETLIRSTTATGGAALSNPLAIAQDPQGNLYVGEFGAGRIAVFDPIGPGCWQDSGPADAPLSLLDAAGTAIEDRLYLVAGKTSGGYQSSLYIYDAGLDTWTQGANLPAGYPAVENAAAVSIGGLLYVFGGATSAFSGAVANAAVYDPTTDVWTNLPDMPTARSGPGAAVVGGLVYVLGGMDASGTSLESVDVFDPVALSWSTAASMTIARDNPMVASLGGELLVFGGRTRQHAMLPDVDNLDSVEIYDPGTDQWFDATSMPTGRRTGGAVVVDGEVLVMGGERTATGGSFRVVEVYDPATDSWSTLPDMPIGRHGAVWGRIGSAIFVATGGPTGGSAYTSDVDVFHYR